MEIPIVLIVFGSFILALKLVLDYRRERLAVTGRTQASDSSIGTSELKRLVREAVAEAIAPVADRIDDMEPVLRRLESSRAVRALPEATQESRLAATAEAEPDPAADRTD